MGLIEHKKGIKFSRVGPPQPKEIVGAATEDAVRQLDHVHQASVDAFMERARELIEDRGAEVALAASLAALTGHTRELRGRSVLSSIEGCTALIIESERIMESGSKGWYLLRQMLPWEVAEQCKGCVRCKSEHQCIFDVPDNLVQTVVAAKLWNGIKITVAEELPELEQKETNIADASQRLRENKQRMWEKRTGKSSGKGKDDGSKGGKGKDFSKGGCGRGFGGEKGKGSGKGFGGGRGSSDSGRGDGGGRGRGYGS